MAAATRTRKKPAAQQDLNLQPAVGVHLHMPESAYFGAKALGSSDLKTLYWEPANWWAQSDYNVNRRGKISRQYAMEMGTALHTLVLEGDTAFRDRFTTEPDDGADGWLKSVVDEKKALEDIGVRTTGEYDPGRIAQLLKKHGLANRSWRLAIGSYKAGRSIGRKHISEDEERRLRYMAKLIHDHPDLGPALSRGLTEVSVFWRRENDPNTLLRARFDKLLLKLIGDLKSISTWKGKDVAGAVLRAIEDLDYDVQRRLYDEARQIARVFIREGRVFSWSAGGPDRKVLAEEMAILQEIAAQDEWLWVWIFVQIRVDDIGKERAPIIVPRFHRPHGRMWDEAGIKIETALKNYREMHAEFGLSRPWALIEPIRELEDADIRSRLKKEIW